MSKPTNAAKLLPLGTPEDSLEAVDLLQAQFARLRSACTQHADAERDLEIRALRVAAGESALAARLAAVEVREQSAAAALAAAEQREQAAVEALDQSRRREAALILKEESLTQAHEAVRAREEELQRIKARLEGLRHALSSLKAPGEAGNHRSEDLESLIASSVRCAVNTQREADQMATHLQATEVEAAALKKLLSETEQRAESGEKERIALVCRLSEAQSLCARVQSDAESLVAELRAEMKRMAQERDKAQARLDRQTARIERAGLQIQWDDAPKKRAKAK